MEWIYEARTCNVFMTTMLLVRIMVGKVERKDRLEEIMRSVPIVQGDPEWNCVLWVKEALARLKVDGKAMGTSQIDWQRVRDAAMEYVQRKRDEHRFESSSAGTFDMRKPPTFDLVEGKEVIA